MITNLHFMRKAFGSFLYCVIFTLLSVTVYAQAPTISNVAPLRVTDRSIVTVTGTNFTGTLVVKVGATTVSHTIVNATTLTFKTGNSGTVSVAKTGQTTATSPLNITLVSATATTSAAAITRYTSDYNNTYWVSSTAGGAVVPNNHHNVTSFTQGGVVYSTGVNDTQIAANNASFTAADFRAFAISNLPGNTGAPSNFLVFGKAVDGDPGGSLSNAIVTSPAIAGKTVKDVLTDGIHGLNIGTGLTNVAAVMQLEFAISHIDQSKISDGIPDVMIPQIADVNSSQPDYYVFTDVQGNVVGNFRSNNFSTITEVANYAVDFFSLTAGSYNTAVASAAANTTTPTRPIRGAAFQLSDFGINAGNVASIAYFKILTGGDMDSAFYSYNANSIVTLPYIVTQPASQAVCTQNASSATFSVVANGQALSYQWTKGGVNIPGANAASYTINNVTAADVATYRVVITNVAGSVTSNAANLTSIITDVTTWTGAISNDWNVAGNWTCGAIPSATVSAVIPASLSVYPTLSLASGTTKDITVASGASVTVTNVGILQIAGVINNSGIINVADGGVSFIGTTAQNIPANVFQGNTIKDLTINNTAGVTLQGATNLTGILTPTAGTFTTGNFLTLKSNASTTAIIAAVTGTVSGNLTIERYIPAKRAFRFLSSPTTGGTIHSNWQENGVLPDSVGFGTDITGVGGATNGFDASGSNNASLFTFLNNNPNTGTSWFAATSTNVPLVAGVAYRMLVRGDRTVNQASNNAPATATVLRTTGQIIAGDRTITDLNPNADGFSLIGNPYQAPVNMASVLDNASNLLNKNFYYIWDAAVNDRGGYVTVSLPGGTNGVNGSVADQYLQPGQACFIQTATAGAPTLTFKEDYKNLTTTTTTIWKTAAVENPAQIRFSLYGSTETNGTAADGFVVRFGENYNNSLDTFDAIKPSNQDESMGLMNSGKILSYESRSLPVAEEIIPISLTQYRKSNYTYKVAVSGLDNISAHLLDKYTNTITPLVNNTNTEISFTVDSAIPASVVANRFDIVFENALAVSGNSFNGNVRIYPNPAADNFSVQLPSGTQGNVAVKVINTLGQQVYSTNAAPQNGLVKIQPNGILKSGIYMVHISNGTNSTIEKLIIK